jgi:transaldolase
MKIFIDTANIEEIRKANDWGVIDGVTTNPSLVAKEGREFKELVHEIVNIVNGPISVEVISTDAEGMVKEAVELSKWSSNIVIKIPMIPEGLKAVKILCAKGIKANVTLAFSVNQALLAAKAGATYVSPFIGRLDDIGHEGMQIVRDTVKIFNIYNFKTQVIVASIRHPLHVIEAAKAGAHVATVPFIVIEKMFKHPLTDIGLERFLEDWKEVNHEITRD